MKPIPADPLAEISIAQFGRHLRDGTITCEGTTRAYLDRIAALNPRLDAYVHVDADGALATAQGLDRLLQGGTDLGPLMGVAVAVKDLITVEGMPTHCGSVVDISDAVAAEGPFVASLKRAGCVILGKTGCTEFATGSHNVSHPTPWNPTNPAVHMTPGGSSSGSAVAQAAGLCACAVGSDTGGSVRLPAAFCSLFGYKTSTGLWPLAGVLPLCPDMDSLGLFTKSAADAALVYGIISGVPLPPVGRPVAGLVLGVPQHDFFDNLHPSVTTCTETMMRHLSDAGADLVPVELPEVKESVEIFAHLVPSDLLATIGRDRFLAQGNRMDPVVIDRLSHALDLSAESYVVMRRRLIELSERGAERLRGLDGLIAPTTPLVPVPVEECAETEAAVAFIARSLQNTRPGNIYDFCAATLPVGHLCDGNDPVGFQIHCPHGEDSRLLSLCMAIEDLVGMPAKAAPDHWA